MWLTSLCWPVAGIPGYPIGSWVHVKAPVSWILPFPFSEEYLLSSPLNHLVTAADSPCKRQDGKKF